MLSFSYCSGKAENYCKSLFKILDKDQDDSLNFKEYASTIQVQRSNNLEDSLRLVWMLFMNTLLYIKALFWIGFHSIWFQQVESDEATAVD